MRNNGISIIGLIFVILIVAVILGKTSFWHIVFFPFYLLGGVLGLIFGVLLLVGGIIGIMLLIVHFLK